MGKIPPPENRQQEKPGIIVKMFDNWGYSKRTPPRPIGKNEHITYADGNCVKDDQKGGYRAPFFVLKRGKNDR